MTTSSWDDWGGVECASCHQEVFRVLEGRCVPCIRAGELQEDLQERKASQLKEKAAKHGLWKFPKKKRPPTK